MSSPTPSETDVAPRRRSSRRLAIVVVVVVLAGIALGAWRLIPRAELPKEITPEEFAAAERQYRESYRREPTRTGTLSLLAELAVADGELAKAVGCFRAIPTDDPDYGLAARFQEGQVLIRLNQAAEAERNLREFLREASTDAKVPRSHLVTARKWLDYLLSVELRFEDRKAVLAELHRAGQADVFDSKQFFFPTLLLWHSETGRHRLGTFLEQDSGDPHLLTAHGRYLTTEGRLDEARAVLENLHRSAPDDRDCTAALLECLYELADPEAFAAVAQSLPSFQKSEPWLMTRMRGQFALDEQRWQDAVSFFEQALENDPADPVSHMGLARAYGGLRDDAKRTAVQERSRVLADIRVSLVGVTEDDSEASRKLAAACESIGLRDAARTFRGHASRIEQRTDAPGRPAAVPL